MIGSPPAAIAENMSIIHHNRGIEPFGQIKDIREWRNVSAH